MYALLLCHLALSPSKHVLELQVQHFLGVWLLKSAVFFVVQDEKNIDMRKGVVNTS